MNTLKDQRVLVVGGSSGIGFETARAAGSAGASVSIASRSEPRLKAAAAKLGGNNETAVLDTNDNGAIERFFSQGGRGTTLSSPPRRQRADRCAGLISA